MLEDIFADFMWMEIARDADPTKLDPPSPLKELQNTMRIDELLVRNPAYPHHFYTVLEELYKPLDHILLKHAGFTIIDAINASESMQTLIYHNLLGRTEIAKKEYSMLRSHVRNYKKRGIIPKDNRIGIELLKSLACLSDKELKITIDNVCAMWSFHALGDTLSFSADDLSNYSNIPIKRIKSFLELFTIKFRDIPHNYYFFSPTHDFKAKPIIKYKDKYLCPSPSLVDWAIRPAIESVIKNVSDSMWNKYISIRHNYLLNKSIELLKGVMPSSEFTSNLEYITGDDNEEKRVELDALGLYDSILFIVEAKGGSITHPARRGAPERLAKHLKEIIGEAHYQGIRAKSYIESAVVPTFQTKEGNNITINKNQIRDIILISVTLETLGSLTSHNRAIKEVALFCEGDLPWTVNIYDLMVICDIVDIPAIFPHYVRRRIRSLEQGFLSAQDELDIFAYYLSEGLYFEDIQDIAPAKGVNLLSYTSDLDDYYFYKRGIRKKYAPKPKIIMPIEFEQLLKSIEKSNIDNRVHAQMGLLDLSTNSKKELLKYIKTARKKFKKDKTIHDATIYGHQDGGWGITYMVGPGTDQNIKKLQYYCHTKKSQMNANRWYAVYDTGSKKYKIHHVMHFL